MRVYAQIIKLLYQTLRMDNNESVMVGREVCECVCN